MGDYVDRGVAGVECVVLLMVSKLTYPKQIVLLRGNHETREITETNNFKNECIQKLSQHYYFWIMDIFDLLPLACVINNSYFCAHGGLPSQITTVAEIDKLNRKGEVQL